MAWETQGPEYNLNHTNSEGVKLWRCANRATLGKTCPFRVCLGREACMLSWTRSGLLKRKVRLGPQESDSSMGGLKDPKRAAHHQNPWGWHLRETGVKQRKNSQNLVASNSKLYCLTLFLRVRKLGEA